MRLFERLSRFVSIGLVSTLVHYLSLWLLLIANLELWISNLLAFALAFMFSFSWQQRYTFRDRLGPNFQLNQKALILLFMVNLLFAGVFAKLADYKFAFALPLLPAVCNYSFYYLVTGLRSFKVKS